MNAHDHIKSHFDDEAECFDGIIIKLIPFYTEMIGALTRAVCKDTSASLDAIDLGCGTGTVALEVMKVYPYARMTCMDLSANMLDIAKSKLSGFKSAEYEEGNFRTYRFRREYDLMVSSLAMHHIETYDQKFEFYRRIHAALKPDGVFVNADIVLGTSEAIQLMYLERWKDYMGKSVGADEIDVVWKYYNFAVFRGGK
ncbi:MAG: hypothetical protein A2Y33_14740 [Spirochaetes bacterium GWF1_51_8]|nr:MAG: hypothetical protein A2Y33_14740 [Spirochaetes bacterium GWF1_51_8]